METKFSDNPVAQPAAARQRTTTARRYHSDQLFSGHREIEIMHGETLYRLRITALGKLILNK